ncbi:hypothetical protein [Blastococcus sp. CT_GayMR16]|uniref:hypothetical protein n=1 Tax=Blastococcus sp. CT_GayMR16 TaxID=2559607 RepID=UPI0010746CE5|nr:hypothetical protein [Blastococcus sp. CT_GayMR16]TFV90554.1 hypothetical protein E4P38_03800 [Blastococcus sp. CT_GayMR16]
MKRRIMTLVLALGVALTPVIAPVAHAVPVMNRVPAAYADAVRLLTRPPSAVLLPAPPAGGTAALLDAVNQHRLGLAVVPPLGALPAPQVEALAGVPQPYAGRVAALLQTILACPARGGPACATATNDALVAVLRTPAPAFADVDLWPTLYIDGNGGSNTYRHDYIVLIDRGGNDTYDNNAGGNLVDVQRGPAGSAAPIKADAVGCEQAQGIATLPANNTFDCVSMPQVALLDYRGFGFSNDTYGVMKSPRASDHNPPPTGPRAVDGSCTTSSLIRRIVVEGSGFEGNGLLMDVDGHDRYLGKTAAQGSAHVSGVGVLRDLGRGNDSYLAIRNSQGFSLVGELGVLQDDGGNDRYDTYMPRKRNPAAAYQTPGSGGVIDDTGTCDNLPRMVQGSGLAGGYGLLTDQDGWDTYVGAPPATQPFAPPVQFLHSSQGFGCSGGTGELRDTGLDHDVYREGPTRADGMSVTQVQTPCAPDAPGVSVFLDDGPRS